MYRDVISFRHVELIRLRKVKPTASVLPAIGRDCACVAARRIQQFWWKAVGRGNSEATVTLTLFFDDEGR